MSGKVIAHFGGAGKGGGQAAQHAHHQKEEGNTDVAATNDTVKQQDGRAQEANIKEVTAACGADLMVALAAHRQQHFSA